MTQEKILKESDVWACSKCGKESKYREVKKNGTIIVLCDEHLDDYLYGKGE